MAKLPRATRGHLLAAVRGRGCQERGCLETKLGELGCHSAMEGSRMTKKKNALVGKPPSRAETSCPEFP